MGGVLYTATCLLSQGRNLPLYRPDDLDLEREVETPLGFRKGYINLGCSGISLFFRFVFVFFVPLPNVGSYNLFVSSALLSTEASTEVKNARKHHSISCSHNPVDRSMFSAPSVLPAIVSDTPARARGCRAVQPSMTAGFFPACMAQGFDEESCVVASVAPC